MHPDTPERRLPSCLRAAKRCHRYESLFVVMLVAVLRGLLCILSHNEIHQIRHDGFPVFQDRYGCRTPQGLPQHQMTDIPCPRQRTQYSTYPSKYRYNVRRFLKTVPWARSCKDASSSLGTNRANLSRTSVCSYHSLTSALSRHSTKHLPGLSCLGHPTLDWTRGKKASFKPHHYNSVLRTIFSI